jgi:hypothetical protein
LAITPARDPVIRPRVSKDPDRRVRDCRQHAVGLIVVLSQPRMWRGQHHVEGRRLIVGEVQLASDVDVRFNALQQPELMAAPRVDVVDRAALLGGFGHRYPASDLESV